MSRGGVTTVRQCGRPDGVAVGVTGFRNLTSVSPALPRPTTSPSRHLSRSIYVLRRRETVRAVRINRKRTIERTKKKKRRKTEIKNNNNNYNRSRRTGAYRVSVIAKQLRPNRNNILSVKSHDRCEIIKIKKLDRLTDYTRDVPASPPYRQVTRFAQKIRKIRKMLQ